MILFNILLFFLFLKKVQARASSALWQLPPYPWTTSLTWAAINAIIRLFYYTCNFTPSQNPHYTHTTQTIWLSPLPPLPYTHTTQLYDPPPAPLYTHTHTHHSDYMIISPFPLRPLYTHTTLTKWMSLPLPYIHTHHSNYMIPPFPHSPIHTHHSDYNPSEYITGKFVILAIIL